MRKEVIAHRNPKSPISEVFRTLRTNIQFMNVNKKMNTLLVTSTFPGEGKSWVTSNLAVTFAQAGKKVILVDSDMRKGRTHAIFGISPKPGLSNLLSKTDITEDGRLTEDIVDYIQETEVDNLFVVPAGSVPPNPSELLVSAKMVQVLNELKELCDIVIVDGTPCELVTDSVILSRIIDSTIIVTAHNVTKKDAIQRAIKNIKNVNGNIIGVVFNKVPISGRKYNEKYYYYGNDYKGERKNKPEIVESQKIKNSIISDQKTKKEIIKKQVDEKDDKRQNNGVKEKIGLDNKTEEIFSQINNYLKQERNELKND